MCWLLLFVFVLYIYMYVCIWKDKTLLARFHYSIWFSSLSVANLIYFYALISYFRYCLCSILLFFFFVFGQEILTNVSVKVYFVVNQTKTSAWSLLVPSLLFFFSFFNFILCLWSVALYVVTYLPWPLCLLYLCSY